MANHASSDKRIRQSAKRRLHNRYYAKTTRNAIRALRNTTDKTAALALLPKVTAMLDKLAKNNIIHKNKTCAEIRGLWDTVNDFMGGPFLQHAYYDEHNHSILVMEAFVYAASLVESNLLRKEGSILYSFEWNEKRGE